MQSNHALQTKKQRRPEVGNLQIVPLSSLSMEENYKYYEEYKKLLWTSFCIAKQVADFNRLGQELQNQIQALDRNQFARKVPDSAQSSEVERPKRFRRTNEMIERKSQCPYDKCNKAYASEGSLQQHMKIKHGHQRAEQEIKKENESKG